MLDKEEEEREREEKEEDEEGWKEIGRLSVQISEDISSLSMTTSSPDTNVRRMGETEKDIEANSTRSSSIKPAV
jgi:hypothetical protein